MLALIAALACPNFSDSIPPAMEPRPRLERLRPAPPALLPALLDDLDSGSAALAARRTVAYWEGKPPEQAVEVGGRRYTAAHMAESQRVLAGLLEAGLEGEALRREMESRFDVFEAVGEDGGREGTITGYYEPEILAQPFASEGLIPVYSRPPELERVDPGLGLDFDYGHRDAEGRLEPFYSRAEIAQGALSGRGLELFWTRHPTDLMVLQTQGSGWALFPGGSRRRLSFDGANGHRFRSVGQRLIDCGLIAPGTDPIDILRYLRSRSPEREAELVNINPRYVFFASSESGAATGAAGVELVPGRSVAVDTRHLPLGLSAFLMSRRPVAGDDGRLEGQRDFSRFVFTHDVGSAIRGGVRLDLFWGAGPRAQAEAHRMWSPGKLWVLVLRPDALIN